MAKPKTTKGRSEEGRNESKRGKVAGKGFVVAKTTKSERKAAGKALGKVAAAALPGGLGVKAATKVAGPAVKKAVAKSVKKRALKAANKPAKSAKAVAARKRGANYQKDVDNNLPIKDKGVKQRYKTTLTRKGPGWVGGNSYIKLPKSKGR